MNNQEYQTPFKVDMNKMQFDLLLIICPQDIQQNHWCKPHGTTIVVYDAHNIMGKSKRQPMHANLKEEWSSFFCRLLLLFNMRQAHRT